MCVTHHRRRRCGRGRKPAGFAEWRTFQSLKPLIYADRWGAGLGGGRVRGEYQLQLMLWGKVTSKLMGWLRRGARSWRGCWRLVVADQLKLLRGWGRLVELSGNGNLWSHSFIHSGRCTVRLLKEIFNFKNNFQFRYFYMLIIGGIKDNQIFEYLKKKSLEISSWKRGYRI